MQLRRFKDSQDRVLDERRRIDAEIRPARVEARNDDGTLQMRLLHGECVATSPACGLYVGQVVEVPCSAPFKHLGAAGIPMYRQSREAALMHVESLTPSIYERGFSGTVIVAGRGFTPVSAFEFLLPGTEEVNPGITTDEIRFVSATECEWDITVAADSLVIPEGTGDLSFENVGLPIF